MDADNRSGRAGRCGPTDFGPYAAADWSSYCSYLVRIISGAKIRLGAQIFEEFLHSERGSGVFGGE